MKRGQGERAGGNKEEGSLVRGNLIKKKRKNLFSSLAPSVSLCASHSSIPAYTFRRKITNDAGRGSDGATRMDRREEEKGGSNEGSGKSREK